MYCVVPGGWELLHLFFPKGCLGSQDEAIVKTPGKCNVNMKVMRFPFRHTERGKENSELTDCAEQTSP